MRALAVLLVSVCACATGGLRPCAPAPLAAAAELQGEGEAPLGVDDALGLARRRALASVAEQVRVEVASSFRADESYSGDGQDTLQLDSQVETRAAAVLEGADIRETCSDGVSLRVRIALDRARFAQDAGQRLDGLLVQVRELERGASAAEAAKDRIRAVSLLADAARTAATADALAGTIRAVGKREVAAPPLIQAQDLLRNALARASVRLELQPAADLLGQAGAACLASTGLPLGGGAPDAVLVLRTVFEPALRVAKGLYIVRGTLAASLDRPGGASISAAERHVKGGGEDPAAAQHDALRRLSLEALPGVVDETLAGLRWPLRRCQTARP